MKLIMVMMVFAAATAFAKEVKDFNKVLIQGVQKDIQTDNDQALKVNNAPMRGPASVEEVTGVDQSMQENTKVEKKERQIGNAKW